MIFDVRNLLTSPRLDKLKETNQTVETVILNVVEMDVRLDLDVEAKDVKDLHDPHDQLLSDDDFLATME